MADDDAMVSNMAFDLADKQACLDSHSHAEVDSEVDTDSIFVDDVV